MRLTAIYKPFFVLLVATLFLPPLSARDNLNDDIRVGPAPVIEDPFTPLPPRPPADPPLPPPPPPPSSVVPLTSLPGIDLILSDAADEAADVDLSFSLVNKRAGTTCLGVRFSAGEFILKLNRPDFEFSGDRVGFFFELERLRLNGVELEFEVGCLKEKIGIGVDIRDIVIGASLHPKIDLENPCQLAAPGAFSLDLSIGDIDFSFIPDILEGRAVALVSESLQIALNKFLVSVVREAIERSLHNFICSNLYDLYRLYMGQMGLRVTMHALPEIYIDALQPLYPNVDLREVRFGHSTRQPPDNTTTDCHNIYFSDKGVVNRLSNGELDSISDWRLVLHELRHTEQCSEIGGRRNYAETWFSQMSISVILHGLANLDDFMGEVHDNMPMEENAEARQAEITVLRGAVRVMGAGDPLPDFLVLAYPAGVDPTRVEPVSLSVTESRPAVFSWDTGYEMALLPGRYDLYLATGGVARLAIEDFEIQDADPSTVEFLRQDFAALPRVSLPDEADTIQGVLPVPSGQGPIVLRFARPFIRGDSDANHVVDLADAILTMRWAFVGGVDLDCQKAADFDDTGVVDIGDPVGTLGFLFLGTAMPAAPFPDPGFDETEDGLSCGTSVTFAVP